MSKKSSQAKSASARNRRPFLVLIALVVAGIALFSLTEFESYASVYDAEYVGAEACGDCHTKSYADWQHSPHAKMTQEVSEQAVVGDFDAGAFFAPNDPIAAAKMYQRDGDFIMAIRNIGSDTEYTEFPIAYTIGFQYRQTYVTQEDEGVLRRLPIQWSVERQEFFPYWNFQEQSEPSVHDLWAQMDVNNSAWNLFCARCHTTHLEINDKDEGHTRADVAWVDEGIACESCHGPGSLHANYFEHNYVNRLAAFLNSNVRGEPVAFVANAPKLPAGQDLSVCARCHGADIFMSATDAYRQYEPGYSKEGRINDLSPYFYEAPLTPGRTTPTVEVWDDGRPKGIGMVFRSFAEAACYLETEELRCYDCHDPHNNKAGATAGILSPSEASNAYCGECHQDLVSTQAISQHSKHPAGEVGSFCMDCHMPKTIVNFVAGTDRRTRTHDMSSIPDPASTVLFGAEGSPNGCADCHADQSAEWALEWTEEWWGRP